MVDAEGEVASRQTYDPWGDQLSGPALEMGFLGAQQRRTDPTTDLVQMGIRPYDPTLGAFISEDPILGHLGYGASHNRYAYAWNNPLLYFDLTGRSILDDAADAIADVAGPPLRSAGSAVNAAWDKTAGPRTAIGVAGDGNGGALSEAPGYVSDRAQDFAKSFSNFTTLEQIGTVLGEVGSAAVCWYARSVVANAPTPPSLAVKAAAGATCLALVSSSYAQVPIDIVDEE